MTRSQAVLPHYAKDGYAAITSVIVVLAVIVLVGMATSILSIGNAQMSLGQSKSEEVIALVESCIEDVLLAYNNTGSVPTTRTTPLGSCTIAIDNTTATSATFTTTATITPYTRSIQILANRLDSVTVVNWVQIN